MNLSHKQKKFIKSHRRELTTAQIAQELKIPTDLVSAYIQEKWLGQTSVNTVTSFYSLITDNWQYLLIVTGLNIVLFFRSLFGDFVSDDIPIIKEGKVIGTLSGAFAHPYAFLRDLSYFFIFHLFGRNPVPFHLFHLLHHLGTVILFFLIIRLTINRRVALISTIIFSFHPLIVEPVSWISGGSYVQYSFFLTAALLFYILYIKNASKKLYLWWALCFFFLSLLISDKVVMFPAIPFLYLLAEGKLKKEWKSTVPFFALNLIWIIIYYFQITNRVQTHTLNFGSTAYISNPFLLASVAVVSYLQLFFWPVHLTIFHSDFLLTPFYITVYIASAVIFIMVLLFFYKKQRQIFFWLGFFVISLGVTLLPLKISWIVAERYVYWGTLGLAAASGISFEYLRQRFNRERFVDIVLITVVCLLFWRSFTRIGHWYNEETLWMNTLQTSPNNPVAHSSLGVVYRQKGNLKLAAQEFQRSITLNPSYAEGYYNLGDIYRLGNKLDDAITFFKKAVAINPSLWQGYQALGAAYYLQKNYSLAIANTEKAIALQKDNAELYMNIGVMYYETGRKDSAIAAFEKALTIEPGSTRAQFGLQKAMGN